MSTEGETGGTTEPPALEPPDPNEPHASDAPPVLGPLLPERDTSDDWPAPDQQPAVVADDPEAPPRPFQTVSPIGARTTFESLDYEEPELIPVRGPGSAVMASRILLALWSLAVGASAISVRASPVPDDGDLVTWVGRAGIPIAALAAAAGWWWSDRRTRNIRRLDGRLPSRVRCATAWLAPVVWVLLLALLVVPADPTEPFDIRPTIIVGVFVLALARPYLLVRRIFTSLTRVSSDALIATAAVLDMTSLGLIWWRLTVWPSEITDDTASSAAVLVGLAGATSIALVTSVVVWRLILRAARRAELGRLGALQTRHEHRALRLRGIDPTDPAVWWALVQRRIERERADAAHTAPPGPASTPERLVEQVRKANATMFARLGDEGSTELVGRLRDQFATVLRAPIADDADAEPAAGGEETSVDEVAAGRDAGSRITSVRERLGLGRHATGPSEAALHRLLHQASLSEVEVALAERSDESEDRHVPPKLYALEAVRLLLLAAFVACAALTLWALSDLLGAPARVDGLIDAETVDDVDTVRRGLLAAFTVALAVVPLWAAVLSVYARRAGAAGTRHRVMLLVACVNALCAVAAMAFDGEERGNVGLLLAIPPTALCVWVAVQLEPLHRWAAKRPLKSLAWSTGLAAFLVLTVLAGLQRPIDPTDSPLVLTFGVTLAAIIWCVIVVFAALDSAEFEEAVRLAPALAVRVPARVRRHEPTPQA